MHPDRYTCKKIGINVFLNEIRKPNPALREAESILETKEPPALSKKST